MTAPQPKLVQREDGIGSSDIATIVGVNPYSSPYKLWCEKKGIIPGFEGNRFTLWGHRLEEPIADAWSEETGLSLRSIGTQHLTGYPWAYCSVDRVQSAQRKIIEVKNVGERAGQRWGDGENLVPEEYLIQWQWQSLIMRGLPQLLGDDPSTDWTDGEIVALIGGNDMRRYEMQADNELQRQLFSVAVDWFDRYIRGDEEPDADESGAMSEALKERYPRDEQEPLIQGGAEYEDIALELREAKGIASDADSIVRYHENRVKRLLGASPGVEGVWGHITWKVDKRGRRTFRTKFDKE